MSLFGNLMGQIEGGAAPALISAALAKTNLGDLQGLVNQLQQAGLGTQVQSWLSGGANMPITEAQLQTALSDQHVQALAQHFGIPVDGVLKMLSQHLPTAVEQAGQQGTVQAPSA